MHYPLFQKNQAAGAFVSAAFFGIMRPYNDYNKMNLVEGTKIKGLIKNFQNYCVYIQLNIGYIGIVDKPYEYMTRKERRDYERNQKKMKGKIDA